MTDKQIIRAEIESSMKACEEAFNICPSTAFGSRIDSYKALLSFIDSLPEEPVSEDLEEEFNRFLDEEEGVPRMWHSDEQMEWGMDIARHFAEWQREQLLKDGIEGEIGDIMPLIEVGEMNNYLNYVKAHGLKTGDKVKVILIKEEEK